MAITIDQIEIANAWCDAIDWKVKVHLELVSTKDPVKRRRLQNFYAKAERIADRLAKDLCRTDYK